jgi:alpha-galactosidase
MCTEGLKSYNKEMSDLASGKKEIPFEKKASVEYASSIMNARITDQPFRFAGNILNKGFIANLPYDCCVEVPTYADRLGLHGSFTGSLPEQCAALCQSNISVQELAVIAALEGDREAAYHACLLDPLTAAVLAPHEIRNMVDEMFKAQSVWLPQFKGKENHFPGHWIGRIKNGGKNIKKGKSLKSKIGHYD